MLYRRALPSAFTVELAGKANLQMFVSMILIDCAGQVGGGAWRGGNFTNACVANGLGAVGLTDTSRNAAGLLSRKSLASVN